MAFRKKNLPKYQNENPKQKRNKKKRTAKKEYVKKLPMFF